MIKFRLDICVAKYTSICQTEPWCMRWLYDCQYIVKKINLWHLPHWSYLIGRMPTFSLRCALHCLELYLVHCFTMQWSWHFALCFTVCTVYYAVIFAKAYLAPMVTRGKYTAIHTFRSKSFHYIINSTSSKSFHHNQSRLFIMIGGKEQGNSWVRVITLGIIHQ